MDRTYPIPLNRHSKPSRLTFTVGQSFLACMSIINVLL